MRVEILFHDCTQPYIHLNVKAVVHGLAAVTIHTESARFTYPWVNVQRVKELTP